ncbi:hypothetical protein BH11PLA2_BH11PLA2_02870 [soil metagenome]
MNQKACEALALEKDLYQRGGLLTHIVETEADAEAEAVIRRPAGSLVVREVTPPLLRERLTRCIASTKLDSEGNEVAAHPPAWAVQALHGRGLWPGVQWLDDVVTHPVLLPDGSLLSTGGYHSSFRVFASFPSKLELVIPEKPDKDDVTAAVAMLFDVISDFPFETPAHRSAWLAGLLTPLAWFAFEGPAPLFLIDGNVRGVGKGLLADVISFIVTGRRFATMAYTNDREELRKKITSLAVEGERLVLLDNLAGAVGNDILDNALTSGQWKDRLLGGIVEAAYSKHKRRDEVPLHPGLVEELRLWTLGKPCDSPLWPGKWAVNNEAGDLIRRDLEAARATWIANADTDAEREAREESDFLKYRDSAGHVADFHSLRLRFVTELVRAGVAPKDAKELARHSTITLTMDRYAHVGNRDTAAAVSKLTLPFISRRQADVVSFRATGTDGRSSTGAATGAATFGNSQGEMRAIGETCPVVNGYTQSMQEHKTKDVESVLGESRSDEESTGRPTVFKLPGFGARDKFPSCRHVQYETAWFRSESAMPSLRRKVEFSR